MKYAVIEQGGKQYKVSEGETVTVDKVETEEGKKFSFEKILMVNSGDEVVIGKPYLPNFKVDGLVMKQYKGKKLDVFKFKAKVRYRRQMGFRPMLSDIKIEKISKSASKKDKKS